MLYGNLKMFKERFKYYKRKSPVPDFGSVIDLDKNLQEFASHVNFLLLHKCNLSTLKYRNINSIIYYRYTKWT